MNKIIFLISLIILLAIAGCGMTFEQRCQSFGGSSNADGVCVVSDQNSVGSFSWECPDGKYQWNYAVRDINQIPNGLKSYLYSNGCKDITIYN